LKPAIDEPLKVEVFTNLYGSTPEDPYYDITNDTGDLSNEYSVIEAPDKETARRLVACWNAFLGVPVGEIEARSKASNPR
jgi:hypothetical protein